MFGARTSERLVIVLPAVGGQVRGHVEQARGHPAAGRRDPAQVAAAEAAAVAAAPARAGQLILFVWHLVQSARFSCCTNLRCS